MNSYRSFAILIAALALTPACSSSGSDDAVTGDDANLTQLGASDVKLEGKAVDFGASRKFAVTPKDKARIHAVPFAGNAGDTIKGESHSTWGGTFYVLKKVNSGYVVVANSKVLPKQTGKVDVVLRTAGEFSIGFEAKAPVSARKTASTTVTLKLVGTAAPVTDTSLIGKLKAAYDEDGDQNLSEINIADIPGTTAKADFKQLTKDWADYPPAAYSWDLDGKTIYAIEESNDGGMSIDFYDDKGKPLVGGSASESGDFIWSDG